MTTERRYYRISSPGIYNDQYYSNLPADPTHVYDLVWQPALDADRQMKRIFESAVLEFERICFDSGDPELYPLQTAIVITNGRLFELSKVITNPLDVANARSFNVGGIVGHCQSQLNPRTDHLLVAKRPMSYCPSNVEITPIGGRHEGELHIVLKPPVLAYRIERMEYFEPHQFERQLLTQREMSATGASNQPIRKKD